MIVIVMIEHAENVVVVIGPHGRSGYKARR
jgi:hypothetical protein